MLVTGPTRVSGPTQVVKCKKQIGDEVETWANLTREDVCYEQGPSHGLQKIGIR